MRKSLGARIEHYRRLKGLSQRELASTLNVNKHTVWRWEHGESWPDYENLQKISAALEIEVDRLFETIGSQPPKITPQEALKVLQQAINSSPILDPVAAVDRRLDELQSRPSANVPSELLEALARISQDQGKLNFIVNMARSEAGLPQVDLVKSSKKIGHG